jgi:hypothetical protein
MSSKLKFVFGIVIVGFALLLGWLYTQAESVEITYEGDFQGAAYTNSLLASERMLIDLGMPTTSTTTLGGLPPADHTLLLRTTGASHEKNSVERLHSWVRRGGNLIVMLPSEGSVYRLLMDDLQEGRSPSPLWSAFGVEVEFFGEGLDLEGGGIFEDEFGTGAGDSSDGRIVSEITSMRLARSWFKVQTDSTFRMRQQGKYGGAEGREFGNGFGVRVPIGAGLATFLSTDAWATNEHIGEENHANFLWLLATADGHDLGTPVEALFILEDTSISLLGLLFRDASPLLFSCLVLGLLWMWSRARRFGPPVADPPPIRRDFSEHVDAAAEYLWRNGGARELVEAPRNELRRKLAHARPSLSRLDDGALCAALSESSSLPAQRIQEALLGKSYHTPQTFTRVVQDLASLSKTL